MRVLSVFLTLSLAACGGEDFDTQYERERKAIEERSAQIDQSVQAQMAAESEAAKARAELEAANEAQ